MFVQNGVFQLKNTYCFWSLTKLQNEKKMKGS